MKSVDGRLGSGRKQNRKVSGIGQQSKIERHACFKSVHTEYLTFTAQRDGMRWEQDKGFCDLWSFGVVGVPPGAWKRLL